MAVDLVQPFDSVNHTQLKIETDGSINININNVTIRTDAHTGDDEIAVSQRGHVCAENSTTSLLLSGGVFTGVWEDTLDYGTVVVGIKSDKASATDGLLIEWSADGITKTQDDAFTVAANSGKVFTFGPANRYFRVKYTNGSQGQSTFSLQTILRRVYIKPSSHRISDVIISDDDAELVKAVITGKADSGAFVNYTATNRGNFKVSVQEYGDTPSIDAFARLRVSNAYTLFDSKQLQDKQPLFWDESIGGSGTSIHSAANAEVSMTVTASASDFIIRQTKQRFNYQPGKSQLIFITFQSTQVTGKTAQVGYFDGTGANNLTPNNGIYFECDGVLSWNICKAGSTTETAAQSVWNVDKLNGLGLSGKTLNMADAQIAVIDFEWLGVGRVRVGFVIDGLIVYCHYFNHANNGFATVYMSSPNLPVRYVVKSNGVGTGSLKHICSSVISEGGIEKTGILRGIDTGVSLITGLAAGTSYAILGIRLSATYKDITVIPESLSVICGTNDSFRWRLQLNPVITGTFTYGALVNSSVEYAVGTSGSTVTTAGLIISTGYASVTSRQVSQELNTALRIGVSIAGVSDTLVLAITPISANTSVSASLTFRELL